MKATPDWIQQADQAMQRAARRARELAQRTHTSLHVMKAGEIVAITPSEPETTLREEPSPYGTKIPS
jgi:hypothetical protein